MPRRVLVLGALATASLWLSATGSASASASQSNPATGYVALYENPDGSGRQWVTSYNVCRPVETQVPGIVSAFYNQPATGCQVVLTKSWQSFKLCAGFGEVPAALRGSPRLRIEPGTSEPCQV